MSGRFSDDADLACRIAATAGELLLSLQRCGLFESKAMGKAGDELANDFILRALAQHRPDDAVLSEEEKNDAARCGRERVWIVDPLDGTREYSEIRSDWAVHIALAVDGRTCAPTLSLTSMAGRSAASSPEPAGRVL